MPNFKFHHWRNLKADSIMVHLQVYFRQKVAPSAFLSFFKKAPLIFFLLFSKSKGMTVAQKIRGFAALQATILGQRRRQSQKSYVTCSKLHNQ